MLHVNVASKLDFGAFTVSDALSTSCPKPPPQIFPLQPSRPVCIFLHFFQFLPSIVLPKVCRLTCQSLTFQTSPSNSWIRPPTATGLGPRSVSTKLWSIVAWTHPIAMDTSIHGNSSCVCPISPPPSNFRPRKFSCRRCLAALLELPVHNENSSMACRRCPWNLKPFF